MHAPHTSICEVVRGTKTDGDVPVDTLVLRALHSYMEKIVTGRLVHGPLLAWAIVMGDRLQDFRSGSNQPCYLMPKRDGVHFRDYPWADHGTHIPRITTFLCHPHTIKAMPYCDTDALQCLPDGMGH